MPALERLSRATLNLFHGPRFGAETGKIHFSRSGKRNCNLVVSEREVNRFPPPPEGGGPHRQILWKYPSDGQPVPAIEPAEGWSCQAIVSGPNECRQSPVVEKLILFQDGAMVRTYGELYTDEAFLAALKDADERSGNALVVGSS